MINTRRKQTRVSEQYGFFYVIPRCKRIKRLILRASPKYGNTGSQGKIREFIMKIKRGLSGTPQDSSSIICLWIFINPIQFGTSDKKKFRETQVVPSFAGNRKTSFEDAGRFLVHLGFSVAEVDPDRICKHIYLQAFKFVQISDSFEHHVFLKMLMLDKYRCTV